MQRLADGHEPRRGVVSPEVTGHQLRLTPAVGAELAHDNRAGRAVRRRGEGDEDLAAVHDRDRGIAGQGACTCGHLIDLGSPAHTLHGGIASIVFGCAVVSLIVRPVRIGGAARLVAARGHQKECRDEAHRECAADALHGHGATPSKRDASRAASRQCAGARTIPPFTPHSGRHMGVAAAVLGVCSCRTEWQLMDTRYGVRLLPHSAAAKRMVTFVRRGRTGLAIAASRPRRRIQWIAWNRVFTGPIRCFGAGDSPLASASRSRSMRRSSPRGWRFLRPSSTFVCDPRLARLRKSSASSCMLPPS